MFVHHESNQKLNLNQCANRLDLWNNGMLLTVELMELLWICRMWINELRILEIVLVFGTASDVF